LDRIIAIIGFNFCFCPGFELGLLVDASLFPELGGILLGLSKDGFGGDSIR
jgi:hypothetical protein